MEGRKQSWLRGVAKPFDGKRVRGTDARKDGYQLGASMELLGKGVLKYCLKESRLRG